MPHHQGLTPIRVFVGGNRAAREARIREAAGPEAPAPHEDGSAADWPFRRDITPAARAAVLSDGPQTIWIRDVHLAFPAGQTAGTRLVLTQSTYQLQRWLDWLDLHPASRIVADADGTQLARCAPEAYARRGPWSRIEIVEIPDAPEGPAPRQASVEADTSTVHRAFSQPNREQRLVACRAAATGDPANPALELAVGSVCMELQLVQEAHDAISRALEIAPDWEAVHFEYGKLWLRADDTGRAAEAFAEATRLMPSFSAAASNLGAALGELDRGGEALDALQRALEHDPYGHPTLNNVGVILRELGRLDEAEAMFRQVIDLAPAFVFGRYNLAHTLFVAGRFDEARQAYVDAFTRDPQKSPRQECRLAVARAAAGDAEGAIRNLQSATERMPAQVLNDALSEAESTLMALSDIADQDAGLLRVLDVVRATLRS